VRAAWGLLAVRPSACVCVCVSCVCSKAGLHTITVLRLWWRRRHVTGCLRGVLTEDERALHVHQRGIERECASECAVLYRRCVVVTLCGLCSCMADCLSFFQGMASIGAAPGPLCGAHGCFGHVPCNLSAESHSLSSLACQIVGIPSNHLGSLVSPPTICVCTLHGSSRPQVGPSRSRIA
jgi:hypothetical protein